MPTDIGGRHRYVRQYGQWFWPHRHALTLSVALAVLVAVLQAVGPLVMRYVIDDVLLDGTLSASTRAWRLHVAGAGYAVVIVGAILLSALRDCQIRILTVRLTLQLRRRLFHRLLHLPLERLQGMKAGGILSRLTGDVDATTGLLQSGFVTPSIATLRVVVTMGMLLSINAKLSVAALAILVGLLAVSLRVARHVRPIHLAVRRDAERLDGRVGEVFSGIRVVRAFGAERRELLTYARSRHGIARRELLARWHAQAMAVCWSLLTGAVSIVAVWYGGHLNLRSGASIGDIMAFQAYALMLIGPMADIVGSFSEVQRALAAAERVADLLTAEFDKPDHPSAQDAPRHVREIRFDHVTFAYQPGKPVLRDFTATVPGGSVVALVGRSGAGKTTVTDLVARFLDPTTGAILLNGCDLRDLRLRSYRQLLAIVQQDVFLFDGSVRENIAYARPTATDAEIEAAARQANAHEFIVRLPQGYETVIGERGVKLSGGQCQRLAIARALLAAPEILILDEATSNLDVESERQIQDALETLVAGRTVFIVAHRLSTIRHADQILVLEEGRVVESGTHDELLRLRGAYHAMVCRQLEQGAVDPSFVLPSASVRAVG